MAKQLRVTVKISVFVLCSIFVFWRLLDTSVIPVVTTPHSSLNTLIRNDNSYNATPHSSLNTLIRNNNSYHSQDIVELKQFYRAKRNHPLEFKKQRPAPLLKYYKYKVEIDCGRDHKGNLIVIDERHRGKRTYGGSSFRIVSTSTSLRQTCSFEDYFNGTYVAFCILDRADCSNITIYLMYVDYMAYTHKTHPSNKFLWTVKICTTNCYSMNSTIKTSWNGFPTVSLQRRVELQNRMTWQSINDSLKLFIRDENNKHWQHYQPLNESKLCTCVRHKRVVMVGSSHMRFKADYLFMNCYSLPSNVPRKHERISIGNIDFIWLRFLAEYESAWTKHLQPLNITRGDIVFLQTGAWDFNQHRLDYVLGRGLELFKSGLKYIRDMLVTRGASLVLVTVPPYSELSHNPDRGSRNNFALAAFNVLVTSAAVNMAVPVHDEFGLILPRCEEFVCYSHYLCRDPKVDNLMHGEVGLISCNMMLRSVCVP